MSAAMSWPGLFAYASLRMPLALLELPLFVLLPAYYSQSLGLPLAWVGGVLFVARLLDAGADPLIGMALDRLHRERPLVGVIRWALLAMAVGFIAMLWPPALSPIQLVLWLGASSMLTYLAWSLVSIAHQAWGATFGDSAPQRMRVTGVREAFGLFGVIVSAALLDAARVPALSAVFLLMVGVTAVGLRAAPAPALRAQARLPDQTPTLGMYWARVSADRIFRRLLAVFMLNGVASAVPATMLLFFVADVLHAPGRAPLFLLIYFVAGAVGMPIWVAVAGRAGLGRTWLIGMSCAVLAFVWAASLGAGDVIAFGVICALTGLALGADLAVPPALLAAVIAAAGGRGQREGSYFGIWSLATKLNLAVAGGIGLPALAWLGYEPGRASDPDEAARSLVLVYAVLPCVIKLVAALALWRAARVAPKGVFA